VALLDFAKGFFGFFGALIPRPHVNGAPKAPTQAAIDYEKYNATQNAAQAAKTAASNAQAISAVKSIPIVGAPLAIFASVLSSLQQAPSHPFPPPDPNYDPYDYIYYYAHEGAVIGWMDLRGVQPGESGYLIGMPFPENPLPAGGARISGLFKDVSGRNVEGKFWFNACRHDLLLRQSGGEKLYARQQFFMDHNPHDLLLEPDDIDALIVQPPKVNGTDLLGNPPKSDARTYNQIIGANAVTLAGTLKTQIDALRAKATGPFAGMFNGLADKLQAQLATLQPYLS
jgi:hypothetical protein